MGLSVRRFGVAGDYAAWVMCRRRRAAMCLPVMTRRRTAAASVVTASGRTTTTPLEPPPWCPFELPLQGRPGGGVTLW